MKKELTNTENVDNYYKRRRLRWAIIALSSLTIILAFSSLVFHLGIGYALVTFLITIVLKRMYSKTTIELKDEEKTTKKKQK